MRRQQLTISAVRDAGFGLLLAVFLGAYASELSAQSPSTSTPPPLLVAPSPTTAPTIYFLTKGVWITIDDKAYGFGTGTQLELVQDYGNRVVVRNGNYEFSVDRALVTNDRAVAKQASDAEIAKRDAEIEQLREKVKTQMFAAQAVKAREEQEAADQLLGAEQARQWEAEQEREVGAERRRATLLIQRQRERTLRNTIATRGLEDRDEIEDLRNAQARQAEQAQLRQRASQEVEQLEEKWRGDPKSLLNSSGPSYKNGIENDVHNANDSGLQGRFETLKLQIDEARADQEIRQRQADPFFNRP